METKKLIEQLEKDFVKEDMIDDWSKQTESIKEYLTEQYQQRSIGLMCDFTSEINHVYTAVFLSREVMEKILKNPKENSILFVHHPANWDLKQAPNVFEQIDPELVKQFKEKKISIYNLHGPLDNYSDYSTSVTLAKKLGVKIEKPFAPYLGTLCGVFGKIDLETIQELKERFEKVVNHKVSLYNYGDENIKNNKVAVIGGGGNSLDLTKWVAEEGVKTFVTGITVKNQRSEEAHNYLQQNKINMLGGTHYSTEKFACMSMVDYFKQLGLSAEFVEESPGMEDL
jgi:putative NIF3 family GTP cyclohydrolase 1 type 2